MPHRRILSIWFPRLGAERALRADRGLTEAPLATVAEAGNLQMLASLSEAAEAAGLRAGQPLRDARAMCPGLATRPADPRREASALAALRRWAGRFSPWIAEEPPDALIVDLTGCAHLFGGEAALLDQVTADCADLRLTVRAGIADTVGAAWALARFAGRGAGPARSGDDVEQEARATRARAARRRPGRQGNARSVDGSSDGPANRRPGPDPGPAACPPRGRVGASPAAPPGTAMAAAGDPRIAPPGRTRQALAALPVAALRLTPEDAAALARLGLRRIDALDGQPRAALARRFGRGLVRRLDQAMGVEPEPVSPAAAERRFALRMSLPDPIGLEADLLAGIDRLLPALSVRLQAAGRGARRVRLQAWRSDHRIEEVEVGLARPAAEAARIRPLLTLKLAEIDAGPGIDVLRLEAHVTEPLHPRQHKGHLDAAGDVAARLQAGSAFDDLLGRLGARVGMEALSRLHPACSHIPEKTASRLAAAWSDPAEHWPAAAAPRPLQIWRPEPVMAPDIPDPPERFGWRGRVHGRSAAAGPERIAPEWWLDEPEWRSGVRDYWQVVTGEGARLWLYYAHGGEMSGGWFCQGAFD